MNRRSGVVVGSPLSKQACWMTLLRLAQVKEARERRRTEHGTRRAGAGVDRFACPSCEINVGDSTRASIRPAAVPLREVGEGVDTARGGERAWLFGGVFKRVAQRVDPVSL